MMKTVLPWFLAGIVVLAGVTSGEPVTSTAAERSDSAQAAPEPAEDIPKAIPVEMPGVEKPTVAALSEPAEKAAPDDASAPEAEEPVPKAVPVDPKTLLEEEKTSEPAESDEKSEFPGWGGDERSPVPVEMLDDYFARRPEGLLVDPQHLLSPEASRACEEFLRAHSADSSIDLVVYLFGGAQEVPESVGLKKQVGRLYADGRPSVVVLYYFGKPQRAEAVLAPQLAQVVSDVEARRHVESSMVRALEKSEPAEQLQEFLSEMATRLYWIEGAMRGETAAPLGDKPVVVLPEREKAVPDKKSPDKVEMVLGLVLPWLGWILAGLGGVLTLASAFWLWRRFFRYRFPDAEVPERLGGQFGAGIGAVMKFDSLSAPPSVQRKQMPDFVKGL